MKWQNTYPAYTSRRYAHGYAQVKYRRWHRQPHLDLLESSESQSLHWMFSYTCWRRVVRDDEAAVYGRCHGWLQYLRAMGGFRLVCNPEVPDIRSGQKESLLAIRLWAPYHNVCSPYNHTAHLSNLLSSSQKPQQRCSPHARFRSPSSARCSGEPSPLPHPM